MRFSSSALDRAILALLAIVVVVANVLVFVVVPNERVMGPVQRIFYFHVGSAFATYCAVLVMLIAGLWYLATREPAADQWAEASGEVGFVFCSIVMASGMIWAKSAWNTAFSWSEPRLVSFLCLWLIFLAINVLRRFGDPARVAAHAAVLSIVGAVLVPIIVYSVKFLAQVGQLHPVVVENRGLREESFRFAFWYCSFALILLQFFLLWIRRRIAAIEARI